MVDSKKDGLSYLLPHVEPAGSRISSDLRLVLDSIGPKTPDIFRRQAEEAVGFIQLLDQGMGIDDPDVRKFVTQLQATTFVLDVIGRLPEKLPPWLQMDFLVANNIREPFRKDALDDKCSTLFRKWIREMGYAYDHIITLDTTRATCPLPRVPKAYIEGEDLLEAHKTDKLSPLLGGLKRAGYPLYMMKSNGSSLVLYFSYDIADFSRADQIFEELGIKYRGPAQDVYNVLFEANKQMRVSSIESNDQSFTRQHGYLKEGIYSPEAFLRDYLALCHKMGKNPAVPYRTSFVYFSSVLDLGHREQEYINRASQVAGYPVLYKGTV